MIMTLAEDIAADLSVGFSGPGFYWLSDGEASISMGACRTQTELREAIRQAVEHGGDWAFWRVDRDPFIEVSK